MITFGILSLLMLLASALLLVLPDSQGLPPDSQNAVIAVFGYLEPFSVFIDFSVLVTLLFAGVVLETAVLSWYVINWVIRKIPGMQ